MIIFGLSIFLILKAVAILILILGAVVLYLRYLKEDDAADAVEKTGGKILDITGDTVIYIIMIVSLIIIANIL